MHEGANCRRVSFEWYISERIYRIYWNLHYGWAKYENGLKQKSLPCGQWCLTGFVPRSGWTSIPLCLVSAGNIGQASRHLFFVVPKVA